MYTFKAKSNSVCLFPCRPRDGSTLRVEQQAVGLSYPVFWFDRRGRLSIIGRARVTIDIAGPEKKISTAKRSEGLYLVFLYPNSKYTNREKEVRCEEAWKAKCQGLSRVCEQEK